MPTNNKEITPLLWNDEYSVNVKIIDAQHKQLVEIINELSTQIGTFPTAPAVKLILDKILSYKKHHFATEEKYFEEFHYEHAKEHEADHHAFTARVEEMLAENSEDPVKLSFLLVDFLEDWLVNHILTVDKKYTKCFNDHGLF